MPDVGFKYRLDSSGMTLEKCNVLRIGMLINWMSPVQLGKSPPVQDKEPYGN